MEICFHKGTGLYYLQSRYYNPTWGRFINADSQLNPKDGLVGCNMFAYCNNNPVSKYDPSGHSAILIAIGIGAVLGGIYGGISAAANNQDVVEVEEFEAASDTATGFAMVKIILK